MEIGPVPFGGLMNMMAFALPAVAGRREVEGPGTSERLSLFPAKPRGVRSVPWSEETMMRLLS